MSTPIERRSQAFLVDLFTTLREDLARQMRTGAAGRPDPERAAADEAIYGALLDALEGLAPFPREERVRRFVADLGKASDELGEYEQVALEHRAFGELLAALSD